MTLRDRSLLDLPSRWMNQAGTLGFSPIQSYLASNSIFINNPISARARIPSTERSLIPFPGGFLLHTGLPNSGWAAIRRRYGSHWARSPVPVWVHLIGQDLEELSRVARDCEETEGIAAIELGLLPACTLEWMRQLIHAVRGELPLVLHISSGEAVSLIMNLPDEVAAVTLGSPRGTLASTGGKLIQGRLHGPGLFPQLLDGLNRLRGFDRPLILSGICNLRDATTALNCGAAAVQMDHFCWNDALPDSTA